jgi:hypothetical protein
MLDEIGQAIDHSSDEDLIVDERELFETTKFVGVAWIREWQHKASDIGLKQCGENVLQRNITVMRGFRVAPAHVQPNPLAGDILDRPVDGRNDRLDEANEFGNWLILEGDMAFEREIRGIDL